jgi:hypothetical protein
VNYADAVENTDMSMLQRVPHHVETLLQIMMS